ncbi:MAG: stage III sporulation protein AF [Clostridia bacterium]|nr:stage III sporulation protein AF [Clostridia bacterium]
MDHVREYAISIIVVSLLAVLLENILPNNSSKKYISIMIGLLVMLVILTPLSCLPHFSETFAFPALRLTDAELSTPTAYAFVSEGFEERLSYRISEDILSVYGTSVNCQVKCNLNEKGQITGIQRIKLSPYSEDLCRFIAEKYGFEEATIIP